MTVVMAMGDFDLSDGFMASLSGVVAALVFISGGSTPMAIAAALLCDSCLHSRSAKATLMPLWRYAPSKV
jgi:ribose/xylose/arabinose/galactoside ABC-type transport system permease subunit